MRNCLLLFGLAACAGPSSDPIGDGDTDPGGDSDLDTPPCIDPADADCDGVPAEWDCDDADPANACQSPGVSTLVGSWYCPEGEGFNRPNLVHRMGNHLQLVFDFHDATEGWCRKLGDVQILSDDGPDDLQAVIVHTAPADEYDFYWRATRDGSSLPLEMTWEIDYTRFPNWEPSMPTGSALTCIRCGDFGDQEGCDAEASPWPIDPDHPVDELTVCPASHAR